MITQTDIDKVVTGSVTEMLLNLGVPLDDLRADDLYQVARIAAWEAQSRWEKGKGSSLTTWAVCRAKGAVLDELRRDRAVSGYPRGDSPVLTEYDSVEERLDEGYETESNLLGEFSTPHRGMREVALSRMWGSMRRLTERQKEAVILRYQYDYSVAEVAQTMGISGTAVRKLINRGVAKMHTRAEYTQE